MHLVYAIIGTSVPKKSIIREMGATILTNRVEFLFEEDAPLDGGSQNENRRAMIDAATNVLFVWDRRNISEWVEYAREQGKSVEVVNPAFISA